LGLILTKEFMKLQNGEILVESEFGKGSTFTLIYPKKKI
jgi:signal transduction histidine kinase